MRWLIDEGLPKVLVDWLVGEGHDVLDIAASDLRGSSDKHLWHIAAQQDRLIITRDVGFVPDVVGASPPGLVLVRAPHTYLAGAILHLVQDGLARAPASTLTGSLTVNRPGPVRQRPLASLTAGE
jgi:hypothetical protein